MTPALEAATPDVLARHGVEIIHHFGGGVYAKEARIPAGTMLVQHSHPHAHLSVLAAGRVSVKQVDMLRGLFEAREVEHQAPACITIPAGVQHSVTAITDATWMCIHQSDETDAAKIDEAVLHG